MPTTQLNWQKSSYCPEGNSCVHIAADPATETLHLTETGDSTGAILTTTPTAFRTLLHTLKKEAHRG
ncbi:DUF397 domain-containing protein [Streptomyces avermitilis]